MININSIEQIDELVAKYLGWKKTEVGYSSPTYPDVERLPRFTTNPWWNHHIVDYLLKDEVTISYKLTSEESSCTIEYNSPAKEYYRGYTINRPNQAQLALCLAFLKYSNVQFTLNQEFIYDINNNLD